MTVQKFEPTVDGEASANAVPGPKNVVFDGVGFTVLTGSDYTPPVPPPSLIPASEFRARFTQPEMMAITQLAYSGTGDANIQYLLLKLQTNETGVDLALAETIGGVDYLVGKGVLTTARKAEILA